MVTTKLGRHFYFPKKIEKFKLGHTGLVPYVDESGTVCGEVPLEYGFAVIV